jgi:hypothetical protein
MWSELALQFLGVVTNPVIVLMPGLMCLMTRRKLWIVAGTSAAAAGFGAVEAAGSGLVLGALILLTSAMAGAIAAEVVLAVVLPLGLMALSAALWLQALVRRRRGGPEA